MPVTYIWATPQKLACFLDASWNQPGFGSHQQTSQITHQARGYIHHRLYIKHIYIYITDYASSVYIYITDYTSRMKVIYTSTHQELKLQVTSYKVYACKFKFTGYKFQVTSSKFTVSEHLEWTHTACAGSSWKLPFGSMISLRMKSQSIRWTILSAPWSTSWVAL